MAKLSIKVFDMNAKEVDTLELNQDLFGVEYNEPVIHEVIVAENANARQGTKSTLSVSEVRGHHKKPYAQKHTGNARHGNTKAPQYKGGGKVHSINPRDFSKKVNKQKKILAFVSALSQKFNQNEITVVDEIKLADVKTKVIADMLKAFKFDRKTIIVLDTNDEKVLKASANIPFLTTTTADLLSTYEVVANKNVVFTKSAIKKLEEARI
ncbi:MAG: 50S ribosomal protein L4 [Clostridia bacterium]|nr:50S ribosomal protein L4 [Clostridia bacterium]